MSQYQLTIENPTTYTLQVSSGVGIPPGGSSGQVLAKSSGTDYAVSWTTVSGVSGGSLTVREVDGTPSGTATELVFPNGTVAIVGGVATIIGLTGPTGPAGPTGLAGATGATGPTGPTGATGPAGPTGPTGPAGSDGDDGATGPAGPAGATGPAGPTGVTGATGAAGVGVPAGGSTGQVLTKTSSADYATAWTTVSGVGGFELIVREVDGDPDAPVTELVFPNGTVAIVGGVATITGLTGPAGPAGPTGPAGATGATGPQGPAGDTGPAGPTGPTGATGAAGPGVPTGGTTGQVLAKSSGTDYATNWVTPSGGSSVKQVIPYFTSSIAFLTRQGSSASTMALIANRLYHIPIVIETEREFTHIAVVITAAVASSNVRLGIRNANQSTGEPTDLVVDAGEVSSATTGTKIISGLSATLAPGLYFLDLLSSHAVTVTTWNQPVAILGTNMSGTSSPSILQLVRDSVTYGALPSDETGVSQTVSTSGALIVGIR